MRPELREFFPNLVQDRGRPLADLRADPAITTLPNAEVITGEFIRVKECVDVLRSGCTLLISEILFWDPPQGD